MQKNESESQPEANRAVGVQWDYWCFVTQGCASNGTIYKSHPLKKQTNLNDYLIPYAKINSRWIIELNVTPKMIKLLGENIGVNLYDTRLDNGFLDMSPKAPRT